MIASARQLINTQVYLSCPFNSDKGRPLGSVLEPVSAVLHNFSRDQGIVIQKDGHWPCSTLKVRKSVGKDGWTEETGAQGGRDVWQEEWQEKRMKENGRRQAKEGVERGKRAV